MAMKVATDAVQILGSYGVMNEYSIAKRMRDAKVNQIFDGASQIQKMIVGRALSKLYRSYIEVIWILLKGSVEL